MTHLPHARCVVGLAHHGHLLRLGILLIFAGGAAEAGIAQGVPAASAMRDTVLADGLTVIAVRNPIIPVITIELAFRNGAFTQLQAEEAGLPHLMEHMFFKSFGGGDFGGRASDLDAAYNGTTGVETVTYYLILPSRNLEKGMDLLARTVRSPLFPNAELLREKQRVRNELERRASDPTFLLHFHTDKVLWGTAFRQKNVGGDLLAVRGVSSDALMEHYRRFYVPNNAALIVSGDLSPDEVFNAAGRRFDSWKRGDDPFEGFSHPPVPSLTKDSIIAVEANVPDVTFAVAWQGPSERDDPQGAAAADLFSQIVTQPVSGAYRRLVDSGLFHFLSFSYDNSNHVGPVKLVARTVPEQVIAASSALHAEISRMARSDYFTDDDLEMAKSSLRVARAFGEESAISRAHVLARDWSLGRLDRLSHEGNTVLDQGSDEVRQFVSRYITGQPKVVTMMVSTATIDKHSATLIASLRPWGIR